MAIPVNLKKKNIVLSYEILIAKDIPLAIKEKALSSLLSKNKKGVF